MNCPTPHINAKKGDIAKTVLMPGDPLRAKFIAENFLQNVVLINSVRNMLGYTGLYKGTPVTVMGSGMGMPSIGLYSYELFNFYGVDNIIRIGSIGALQKDIKLKDVIIAVGTSTDSNYAANFGLPGTFAPICSPKLYDAALLAANENNISPKCGNVLSSDVYYGDDAALPNGLKPNDLWAKMGILGIEMEGAALYMNAARSSKNALCICSVSNNIITGEELSTQDREQSFVDMITLALETTTKLQG
ncbi:MAG: purine-nucleoside phosphorylase [Oscillospiraceae bacterium]|nr:purine-nucleoside phosphorylase [Candidatus Equicaccousia limihippi]